jgi:predicted Zn-dependent peptidase
MRFIVSERKTVPVVSFQTYADVGAYDEADGVTGVAHLLEHLAFKGTPRIGTTDFKKEAPLLDAMDDVFYEYLEVGGDNQKAAAKLNAQLESLLEEAGKIAVPNAYGAMLSREGAVGLNAATTHDSTKYYCSLPANKLELWFALEAERFQAPVFRELYSERKVVFEERRMRVDNAALGPFQEEFARRSLTNNYKRPVIGYETDLLRLGRREVASFFAEHYGPRSLTVAIVGDVKVGKVRQLAEKYFGGWRSAATPGAFCDEKSSGEKEPLPIPPLVIFGDDDSSLSPSKLSTPPIGSGRTSRELLAKSRAGPAVLRAFYRPCIRDTLATSNLDLINDAFTGSRSARLYQNLVEEGKALTVSSYASFPAEKHPGQFIMYGIPAPGVSPEELDLLMQAEVASFVEKGPTEAEVRRYAKAAKMGILETLQSNSALAATLASYQVLLGSWEEISSDLERVESLSGTTAAATARKYLRGDNSFVGYIEKI